MPKVDEATSILEEALKLHEAGLWIVPQLGKQAVALGWDKWRLSEDDLRGYLADGTLNIALVLSQSPFMDVECDKLEGKRRLQELCTEDDLRTPTWQSKRGKHRLYLRLEGLPDRAKVEVEGIEFRIGNKGALSTLPPSVHPDGPRYRWLPGLSIWDLEPLPLPDKLAALLKRSLKGEGGIRTRDVTEGQTITEGGRNDELYRHGCRLVRLGETDEIIEEVLRGCNRRQCKPPLEEAEVAGILKSVRRTRDKQEAEDRRMVPEACSTWRACEDRWKLALKWSPGLRRALACMFASVVSTPAVGDQLWVRVISPPATAKSTLCEALAVNKDWVLAKSTIRGFHSGFMTDRAGEENHSLILKATGKTLVIKDGDTLLQSPNLPQILSEARDVYDGTSRSDYRNSMGRDHEGIKFTMVLCGTSSLHQLDSSELGERFLTVVIMDRIDLDMEESILWRVANRALSSMAMTADGKLETHHSPDLAEAMRLTGGYVGWLRERGPQLLPTVLMGESALRACIDCGKLVAYLRAQPSKTNSMTERELASRLVSQFVRLATCLSVVLNKPGVDAEVMEMVRLTALDSSRGQSLEIAKAMAGKPRGANARVLGNAVDRSEHKTRTHLHFLKRIGAVECFKIRGEGMLRWRLTEQVKGLVERLLPEGD